MTNVAIIPITAKVERQSNDCPISRPSGKPKIIANELPNASKPNACCFLSLGATRITSEAVIDQKMACAKAMPIREMSNTQKFHATTERIWLTIKRAKIKSSNFFRSTFTVSNINGNELRNTIHAYTVIISPTVAVSI